MANSLPFAVVADGNLAVKIGELLCEALYGDLAQQRPLLAADIGTFWRVEGNRNRDGAIVGSAEFFLSIEKRDGRVIDIGEYMRHPSFEGYYTRNKEEQTQEAADQADAKLAQKYTAGMLFLTKLARGGVILSNDLAIKISELFCEAHYADLYRQAPLVAVDKESYWRVEGSWNRDGEADGLGPFFISIQKDNGQVNQIGE